MADINKLLTTSTMQYSTRYNSQRKIVKTSTDTLVSFVATTTGEIKYSYSTDEGVNWSAFSADIFTELPLNDFDVIIDSSDNMYLTISRYHTSYCLVYFIKLTKTAGNTWSVGSTITVSEGSFGGGYSSSHITRRANGDLWIINFNSTYSTFNYFYSTDEGVNWSSRATESLGARWRAGDIVLHNDNVGFFCTQANSTPAYNKELRFYIYDHVGLSWSYTTIYDNDDIVSTIYGICALKIANDDLYVSVATTSGIKIFNWNGSVWDGGTLISANSSDSMPSLTSVGNKPVIIYRTPSSPESKLVYNKYNGTTWSSSIDITDGANYVFSPNALESSPTNIVAIHQRDNVSPYDLYFFSIIVGEAINTEESLGFSDLIELIVSNETIEINESLGFGDNNLLDIFKIDEIESLGFSDTIELIVEATINESSKIISYNPLVIITDTAPVTIAKVDISVPASPAWTRYIINVPPETVKNAKDITYNDEFGFIYITCADGQLLKVDITDFTIRTQIDTEDLNNLIYVDNLATHLKTYASTDNATGEIILIDEAELKSITLDVRFLKQTNKIINLQANTVLSKSVALDARVVATKTSAIGLDIRFLKYDYSVVSEHPLDYTDWIVKINDVDMVPLNDIDMKSIIITHTSDNTSLATFTLHRQHDKLNYTNAGVSSEITNNNSVKVYIDGNEIFNGKVSSIITQSENEFVSVTAQMAMPVSRRNKVSIPLASVGEQLNLYHCLVDNVTIDNPYVDPNDETPEYYKGVMYDKGIEIKQKVSRWKSFTNVVDEIIDGSFEPEQNWSYFWKATLKYLTSVSGMFGVTESVTNARYIGTSLSPIGSDVIELTGAYYSYQRVYDDTETDLGYGYIGSAPYLEVSGPNGKLYTMERWEDRYDGLYSVRDDSYDNLDIISRIAGLEYEKLQNINGNILPITQADIELSLNAYFYYDIHLLTRLNITNTITSNIYKNLNGFPIAVKTIIISSNDMKVVLTCDNQKSQQELDEIDARYPEEDSGNRPGSVKLQNSKFDILTRTYVS